MRKLIALGCSLLFLDCWSQSGSDSLLVLPGVSPSIAFESYRAGYLTPTDSAGWDFHSAGEVRAKEFAIRLKPVVPHPKDLFKDCILIEPMKMATTGHSRQFFIGVDRGNTEQLGRGVVPASIRFYADTTGMIDNPIHGSLVSSNFPQSITSDYAKPFYFRKYEVSNKEYREFVQWVTDSIARTRLGYILPNGLLDRKKKYDLYDNKTDSVTMLILPKEERFYSRKDINARKLNYKFVQRPLEYGFDTINVYPDTLSWIEDWHFGIVSEPMTNMYFWHPAYDDYAVAGINYWQCLAFLEWKTCQLQRYLDKKKLNVKIECVLPSEIEWDYVSTAETKDENIILLAGRYFEIADRSWQTDLSLYFDYTTDIPVYEYRFDPRDTVKEILSPGKPPRKPFWAFTDDYDKPLRRHELNNQKMWGNFSEDGYLHPGPVQIDADGFNKHLRYRESNERSQAHYDKTTGVCWMDGNVSEWMREDLDLNWRAIFTRHLRVPNGPYANEEQLIRNYEKYYYDKLPKKGKLVRGANWYDERFALKHGKNVAGMQAKTFCNPDSAHSTLGFRYVIYLSEK